ncbi:MAG: aldehyde dehydrogenase (NAD+), partial [Yoonia sp.]
MEANMADIVNYQMLIDGAWVDASDGVRFDSVNPATGAIWSTIPEATATDVDAAVQAAHAALDGPWGH